MAILETEHLLLEPWSEQRREAFAALGADPQVMRYIGDGSTWTRERADQVFTNQLDHWRQHGFGWRSASLKGPGDWIGFIGLNFVSRLRLAGG
jgi:RimJ/RimL family protein N-acetyltransferase